MVKVMDLFKKLIPFQLKSSSSFVSIIFTIVIFGFLTQLGANLSGELYKSMTPNFPKFVNFLIYLATVSIGIKINFTSVVAFIVIFLAFYKLVDKYLGNLINGTIFFDDFEFSNVGWLLNYWGSKDPDKTCRFEDSMLVFEALPTDLENAKGEYGAYYDLYGKIREGSRYEVSCLVKSSNKAGMGFKLWVHDIKGHNETKSSANFYTPGINWEEVKVGFTGTRSHGIRVHLHSKAGLGKIFVDSVKIVKVG